MGEADNGGGCEWVGQGLLWKISEHSPNFAVNVKLLYKSNVVIINDFKYDVDI